MFVPISELAFLLRAIRNKAYLAIAPWPRPSADGGGSGDPDDLVVLVAYGLDGSDGISGSDQVGDVTAVGTDAFDLVGGHGEKGVG